MREILVLGIFIAFSLILQIFFLRVMHDVLKLQTDDSRFKRMVYMIYVNLIFYIGLVAVLFWQVVKK